MVFKSFRINVIARIIAIILTSFLLFEVLSHDIIFLTPLLIFVLLGIQISSLLRYINKSNQEIISFLDSIKYDDLSSSFSTSGNDSSAVALNQQFNRVIENFQKLRRENEAEYQYLKNIVQHVGIGLITFNKDSGDVQIMNTAARKLLKTSKIKNINELRGISEHMVDIFLRLKTGGRDLVKFDIAGEIIQLAVYAIELTLAGQEFKLVSIQNIQSELEEKEMEAWQNLVSVLTHEIMNSITPIQSLAATVEDELATHRSKSSSKKEEGGEDMEDIHLAIKTIQKRSEGLIRFVQDFRNLTRTPKPKIRTISVGDLLKGIATLMKKEVAASQIKIAISVYPENLEVKADKELIEQVLINLVKNAIQAFEDKPEKIIELKGYRSDKGRPVISVIDNGPGIDEEALQKIFIPFYTTKKSGSGIGLSLSRQIMRLHQGILTVKTKPEQGSEFSLKF